jgi:hypothetical protein
MLAGSHQDLSSWGGHRADVGTISESKRSDPQYPASDSDFPNSILIEEYGDHLREVRGFAASTGSQPNVFSSTWTRPASL